MIATFEIAPSPALAQYVRCYTLREFDTGGKDLIKPWHASHEISIVFFFKAQPVHLMDPQTNKIVREGHYGGVVGLGTHYNGDMVFNGTYLFFEIYFKPCGFTYLFKIPSCKVANQIIDADDLFDSTIKHFYEELSSADGLTAMGLLADSFLINLLKKSNSINSKDKITFISQEIIKNSGNININKLALDANMSFRSLERQFIEQVGIPPKLFCCVSRFNQALNLKLKNPNKSWTSIAFECGFYDQMHLIKDFRRFSGYSPSHFMKESPINE